MPVSIIANTAARYAQASLSSQNEAVNKSTLRMTSGQRVLSAADDASSMAIGTSLKIENSGLKSAILNATSATSMLQIADGALGQISELLSRMSVLAVQAASGHYSDETRVLMDGEFQGLKQEVDRLANSTSFNSVKILAGTPEFELASGGNMAADGVRGVRFDTSIMTADSTFRYAYNSANETLTLTKVSGGTSVSQSVNLTPLLNGSVGAGVNLTGSQTLELGFSQLGVTMTLGAGFLRGADIGNGMTVNPGADITIATPAFAVPVTNLPPTYVEDLTALGGVFSPTTGMLTLGMTSSGAGGPVRLDATPGISYKVGAAALGASGAASDDLVGAGTTVEVWGDLADGSGRTLLGTVTVGATASSAAGTGTLALDVGGGMLTATATGDVAARHLTYKVGTGVLAGEDTIGVDVPAMTLLALGLDTLSLTTQVNSDTAIDAIKAAMVVLNQGRASVGSQQIRLEAVGRNLGVISDNNEAARSAMIDVDVSKEISDLTNNQTLMQASIAMLSRANQMPDILLELLRN